MLCTILYSYGPVEPDIFEGLAVPVPYGLYLNPFLVGGVPTGFYFEFLNIFLSRGVISSQASTAITIGSL